MQLWCDQRISVETRWGAERRDVHTERPFALVGSHPLADIRLDDGQAKRAALLIVVGEEILCRPLENAGENAATVLASGAVRLSDVELLPRIKVGRRRNAIDASLAWPIPLVEVARPGAATTSYRLTRPLSLVGRHPANDIELRCPDVSVFHCALYAQQGRLWCIDLLSGNGTYLNGQRITCRELLLGDQLTIGPYHLVFERYSRMKPPGGSKPRLSEVPSLPSHASQEDAVAELPLVPQAGHQDDSPAVQASPARALVPVATFDRPAATPQSSEDRLTHFVTNRLVAMDRWRKRRIALLWFGGITAVAAAVLLLAGTIYWWLNT